MKGLPIIELIVTVMEHYLAISKKAQHHIIVLDNADNANVMNKIGLLIQKLEK